ncbi:MAG: gluconate 2-dehydrogenase subunit 3 family protein [Caldimonas sp.]
MDRPPASADASDEPASPERRRAARRLALAAAFACTDLAALAATPAPAAGGERLARTFASFCDTLVPADALTPAASALGVANAILGELRGDELGERLLAAGCAWLDADCQGDFAGAGEAARVAALERMQAMPWESPAGRFFVVMRNTVMADYYVQPAAWRGLALDRPPQPLGFFDAVR